MLPTSGRTGRTCASSRADCILDTCGFPRRLAVRMACDPFCSVEAALVPDKAECWDFHGMRLNPKPSLNGSMWGIAHKTFDRRRTTMVSASCQDHQLHMAASRRIIVNLVKKRNEGLIGLRVRRRIIVKLATPHIRRLRSPTSSRRCCARRRLVQLYFDRKGWKSL